MLHIGRKERRQKIYKKLGKIILVILFFCLLLIVWNMLRTLQVRNEQRSAHWLHMSNHNLDKMPDEETVIWPTLRDMDAKNDYFGDYNGPKNLIDIHNIEQGAGDPTLLRQLPDCDGCSNATTSSGN